MPDERTRVMRRRLARRVAAGRGAHAREERDPRDLDPPPEGPPGRERSVRQGRAARGWPSSSCRSRSARPSTAACARSTSSTARSRSVERVIAHHALNWPEARRLMTVPGVEPDRRRDVPGRGRRHPPLPRPAQAGRLPRPGPEGPPVRRRARRATARSPSKAPLRSAHALVEASWSAVRQPGPLRAFYRRVRARRGHQIAIVAAARKLAVPVLVPALARTGLRLRPALADAPRSSAGWRSPPARRAGKTATASGSPPPAPRRRTRPRPPGRSTPTRRPSATAKPPARSRRARARHRGAHHNSPLRAKPRGRPQAPDVCASLRQSLAPTRTIPQEAPTSKPT